MAGPSITVASAAQTNETMLVQRRARAWIDLNRSEYERDPRVDDGVRPQAQSGHGRVHRDQQRVESVGLGPVDQLL